MSGFGPGPTSGFGSSPTAAHSPSPNVQPNATPNANPKVAELQTMFPTVEPTVIEMILESVGGSQDRAIEQLLSMTDENFKPEQISSERREAEQQVDLDAEFARSLALQDQQDQQRHQQQSSPYDHQQQGPGYVPYQPRIRRNGPSPAASDQIYSQGQYQGASRPQGLDDRYQDRPDGQPQGRDGLMEMEKKLTEYAEVGKQTFNSFLSKAKAKYAEYQAGQAQNAASQGQGQGQGSSYAYGNNHYQGQNRSASYAEESAAGWTRASNTPGGGRGGAQGWDRDQVQDRQRSNSRSTSFSTESDFSRDIEQEQEAVPKPAIRKSAGRWNPSDDYVDSTPPAAPAAVKVDIAGRRSPGATTGVAGSPGAKIDATKLGFLPKKKVDLLSTSPGASQSNLQTASGPGSGRNSLDAGRTDLSGDSAYTDFNPGLRKANADIIAKIPPTPPAGKDKSGFGYDSDDDLEYTK